jgi:hypothetical protein
MKSLLFVFLNTALCFSAFAQQKTDKDLNDLRGHVRTVRTTVTYEVKEAGQTVKKGVSSEILETYDKQGNLTEISVPGGMYPVKRLFSRDAQGQRVERYLDLPPDPAAPPPPPPPKLPGGEVRGDDFLTFLTTYQFDPAKRRLEATTHRRSGQLLQIDTYLFDDKGRLLEHARKYRSEEADGTAFRWVYQRDEKGMVTELTSYTVDGKVKSREHYQVTAVDVQGNWIRRVETWSEQDGKLSNETRVSVRTLTYY